MKNLTRFLEYLEEPISLSKNKVDGFRVDTLFPQSSWQVSLKIMLRGDVKYLTAESLQ